MVRRGAATPPLQPCPFCGGKDALRLEQDEVSGWIQVVCNANEEGCGGSSGYDASIKLVAERWNQRSAVSESATTSTELEKKIAAFSMLPDGWDSYGAKAFPRRTIILAMDMAKLIGDEWKAVPCGDGSIQFYRGDEDETIYVSTSDE